MKILIAEVVAKAQSVVEDELDVLYFEFEAYASACPSL